MTRKQLLVAAGAATGSTSVAIAATERGTGVAGLLRSALSDGRAELETRDGIVGIRLAPTATVARAGGGEFVVGDEVGAEGSWRGDSFVAERLLSVIRPVEGRLVGRRGNEVVTTAGSVQLSAVARVRAGSEWFDVRALDRLRGREVAVHTVRDAGSGSALALEVVLDE